MHSSPITLVFSFIAYTIFAQGNVGIGTTNPTNRLDLRNDGTVGVSTIVLGIMSNTSNKPVIQFSEDAVASPTSGMSIEYNGSGTGGNNKMHIRGTDGLPKFTVMTNGYVGIGSASSNRELFISDIGSNGDAIIEMETTSSGTKGMIFGLSQSVGGLLGTTTSTNMTFRTNNSTRMTITNSGEVGIGSSATRSLLTLRGADSPVTGPILTLYGNDSDQTESGRIRFVEAMTSWRGGFIHFDGSANRFHIGVHPTSDEIVSNDLNAISINRGNGFVGIGTSNPGDKLHVSGGDLLVDRGSSTGSLTRQLTIGGSRNGLATFAHLNFQNYDSNDGAVDYIGARISARTVSNCSDCGAMDFYVRTNGGSLSRRLSLSTNTVVGVRVDSDLLVDGRVYPDADDLYDLGSSGARWDDVYATNMFIQTSDKRDKEEIQTLDYGLNEVLQLDPVRFSWIRRPEKGEQIGLIAQDVLKVIPEVIVLHDEVCDPETKQITLVEAERMGMSYGNLVPVLINAIKELEKKNQELSDQIGLQEEILGNLLKQNHIIEEQQRQIEELRTTLIALSRDR